MRKVMLWVLCAFLLGTLTACGSSAAVTELPAAATAAPTEQPAMITENELGTIDGYDYELW